MNYTLVILKEADAEYTEAAVYYEQKQAGLGLKFIAAVQRKLESIAHNPEAYSRRKANFREAPVVIFPFNIVYSFYPKNKVITVSAIFHNSRNPQRKYRK